VRRPAHVDARLRLALRAGSNVGAAADSVDTAGTATHLLVCCRYGEGAAAKIAMLSSAHR
jgi:hypothetical protein